MGVEVRRIACMAIGMALGIVVQRIQGELRPIGVEVLLVRIMTTDLTLAIFVVRKADILGGAGIWSVLNAEVLSLAHFSQTDSKTKRVQSLYRVDKSLSVGWEHTVAVQWSMTVWCLNAMVLTATAIVQTSCDVFAVGRRDAHYTVRHADREGTSSGIFLRDCPPILRLRLSFAVQWGSVVRSEQHYQS
ncbi:hypothetical protein, variant 2 [Exophiala sideris]|uniref:Uncharacterized protein n=1 Tax=Exophiala sideris TaxID=1016849 RepID=A0A0D1X108_9EURO|nr:hypothetical protein, variant 2 [Exophiala sideris]